MATELKIETSRPLAGRNPAPYVASVPGSKSYTNRALVLASQRMGTTEVRNGLVCDDTVGLAAALDSFEGLSITRNGDVFQVVRTKERLGAPEKPCHMGGAGTPARFMMAFAAAAEGVTEVTGIPRLCERPMDDLIDSLRSLGISVECVGSEGCLPVRITGGTPRIDGEWTIDGGVSSQFTSSLLLFAAQQTRGPIRVVVGGNVVSKPYVDMTIAMMNEVGIGVARDGERAIVVQPGKPAHDHIDVEPDASGMSYFLAAAAATATTVEIPGIGQASAQGDVGLARAFADMGCKVELAKDRIRITGQPLTGIDIDMDTMPDVVLTLAVVAPFATGPTRITNIANLRVKECDRINAAARELERLGVKVEEGPDWLVVHPATTTKAARIHTYDDHRVAMAFAVFGLVRDGVDIEDPDCVSKSFPGFWKELARFRAHHDGHA